MSKLWFQMENIKPTVISTFAGCGGSSLGYKLAGFRELLAVECDDHAATTFKANFPEVPLYHGDIAKLSIEECLKLAGNLKAGQLDLFDGSPPCQGFSISGKRKFNDPRNSLFREYVRLLKGLQPKVFVMENVTGMIRGYMKQAYLKIVDELRECGYRVKGEVLNAMYYHVPQHRRRVIIIGVRNDLKIDPSHPKPQSQPMAADQAIKTAIVDDCGNPKGKIYQLMKQVKPGQTLAKALNTTNYFNNIRCPIGKPCPTLLKSITFQGVSIFHPTENRNLSIGELKRIGSFPDGFKLEGTYKDKVARIGNSVPPNMMKAIAEHIRDNILIEATK